MDGAHQDTDFHPPRFRAPVDLEGHLALLPRTATCRGLFFQDTLKRLEAKNRLPAELASRKYQAFGDYPYGDYLRLQLTAAKALFPLDPPGEGLRRLGQGAYDALLDNHIGRVVFGVFGKNFGLIARMAAKGWGVSMNFGNVRVEDRGGHHVQFLFVGMPAFLETLQVGVVEGAMNACGVRGAVNVKMRGLQNATFDIRWE